MSENNLLSGTKIKPKKYYFYIEYFWNIMLFIVWICFICYYFNDNMLKINYYKLISKIADMDISISINILALQVAIFTFFMSYDSKLGKFIKESEGTFNSIKKRLYYAMYLNILNIAIGIVLSFYQFNITTTANSGIIVTSFEKYILYAALIILFASILYSIRFILALVKILIISI